jgi:hypothetical protein
MQAAWRGQGLSKAKLIPAKQIVQNGDFELGANIFIVLYVQYGNSPNDPDQPGGK